MLILPTNLATHLSGENLTLAVCWRITRADGVVLRGTNHDRAITISSGVNAGTYSASSAIMASDVAGKSDGSVTNMEVEGLFQIDANTSITPQQVEAGLFDQAPAVLFLLNWKVPNDGQKILLAGTLGEFYRDNRGRYRSEVRGLTQKLSQMFMDTYSERCNVKQFGDARCGVSVAAIKRTGEVDTVVSRKRFTATLDAGPAPVGDAYYLGGVVTFTSGDCDGFTREIKAHTEISGSSIEILLHEEMPDDFEVGDTFELEPGCDRLFTTCKYIHNNLVNFRGHGFFAVGRSRMMQDPAEASVTTDPNRIPTQAENDALRAALSAQMAALLA